MSLRLLGFPAYSITYFSLYPRYGLSFRKYNTLPLPPDTPSSFQGSEAAAARSWLVQFRNTKLHRSQVEFSFSRSTGPGGQNVNKLNTKATLRCPIDAKWIPPWAQEGLKGSRYFVPSSNAVLFSSSTHRSQAQNVDECLEKLHALITQYASTPFTGRAFTSLETQERVKKLQAASDAGRRKDKIGRSAVKQARSKKNWDR